MKQILKELNEFKDRCLIEKNNLSYNDKSEMRKILINIVSIVDEDLRNIINKNGQLHDDSAWYKKIKQHGNV